MPQPEAAATVLAMPDIVLSTLNAKYIHTAFGLRYLLANLGPLQPRACIIECDINQRPLEVVERLLAQNPRVIGLGIYIWNVAQTTGIVAVVKRLRPDIHIVLGGPEVSYEAEDLPVAQMADYIVQGEGDLAFRDLCQLLLSGQKPSSRFIPAPPPEFAALALPYDLYSAHDIAHRIIYVEASRGCPFTCEFCLSSLDIPVRRAALSAFLEQLQRLLERGVKQFKFVDRTFNLDLHTSRAILEFLFERHQPGHFFHFEMVPDRLPEDLRSLIARFPPGALQFEVGIQTFNEEVSRRIQRRQDYARLEENLRFFRTQTGVHVHADLIAGLPGESLESFAAGFDRLIALGPQEIQVGILKRLRGTHIGRHDAEWQAIYSPNPPYELLQNKLIDFATMQRLRRFARYWDLIGNSGNFVESTPLLWENARSPFDGFMRWSHWLHERVGRTDSIALVRLLELLFDYLAGELQLESTRLAEALWRDYRRGGRKDKPSFLSPFLPMEGSGMRSVKTASTSLRRQARHATRD